MEMLAITTNDIFAEASSTLTGFMDLATDFFISLWNIPMGKIVICMILCRIAIKIVFSIIYNIKLYTIPGFEIEWEDQLWLESNPD